ncbi:MAG: hypothetical protein HGA76_01050 [Candidatus Firestonebacteria bacterium]|nr:hypothetical protein [Candidatus Firestonebacteria bacterium]
MAVNVSVSQTYSYKVLSWEAAKTEFCPGWRPEPTATPVCGETDACPRSDQFQAEPLQEYS